MPIVESYLNRNTNPVYPPIYDSLGRKITYVRFSITDRCNLRCRYCMPPQGIAPKKAQDIISYEEIWRLISLLMAMGVTKVRFTGGEPFVRRGFWDFLRQMTSKPDRPAIHLTTNGVLLSQYLSEINDLSIDGINLSLDSLKPERFFHITHRDLFEPTIKALKHLMQGSIPLKINCVLQQGLNEDEIKDFVALARNHPIQVRFIEQMPFNGARQLPESLDSQGIIREIRNHFQINHEVTIGTARLFQLKGFIGQIGVIAAYSRLFCQTCNRIRITANGLMKRCLFDEDGVNLLNVLRCGATDLELSALIRFAVMGKAANGIVAEENQRLPKESMAQIGG